MLSNLGGTDVGPSVLAAFLASAVEFVEALTSILAIGSVRGWRNTLPGTGAALALLLALVVAFGRALAGIPLGLLQVTVGALLLLFGMRWLRKAVLRAVGVIPLHDETAAFSKQVETMRTHGTSLTGWDRVAFAGAFQITMLEGIEVVFIVSAMSAGGTGLLVPVSLAAVSALLAVAALGLAIRRPLARVPENQLKFVIGVLLSAFGSFCFGEGLDVAWPGEDVSILVLAAGFSPPDCSPARSAARTTPATRCRLT